jgi:hypothetical protein
MLGSSGAVGTEVLKSLGNTQNIEKLTLIGRRTISPEIDIPYDELAIDIHDSNSYESLIV